MSSSYVTCELCGENFSRIAWSHLHWIHGIDFDEYRSRFPDAEITCKDWCEQHSRDLAGREFTPEHRAALSAGDYERWKQPGQKEARSEMMEDLWETEYYREITTEAASEGLTQFYQTEAGQQTIERMVKSKQDYYKSPEGLATRKSISSKNKDNWKDPNYVAGQRRSRGLKPNIDEMILEGFLINYFPGEWKYTGDLSLMVGRKNPDFVHTSKRLVIELFGSYWHSLDPADRTSEETTIDYYKAEGYDCLVVWDSELHKGDYLKDKIENLLKEEIGRN